MNQFQQPLLLPRVFHQIAVAHVCAFKEPESSFVGIIAIDFLELGIIGKASLENCLKLAAFRLIDITIIWASDPNFRAQRIGIETSLLIHVAETPVTYWEGFFIMHRNYIIS